MTASTQHNNPEFYLMDRPEADVPAEGLCVDDQIDAFSIVPLILPIRKIITLMLGLGVFQLVIILIMLIYDKKPIGEFFTEHLPMVFVATCFMLAVVFLYSFFRNRAANRIGPLLIIEKISGTVILPRQNQSFSSDQVFHLQVLSVPGTGRYLMMQITELNLLTYVDGKRMRWPIVGRISEYGKIQPLIQELLANTKMPVMRYRQYKKKGKLRIEISDMRHDSDGDA